MKYLCYIAIFFMPLFKVIGIQSPKEAIKQFPLDDRSVYRIVISREVPTTIMFPGPITAISGANIATGEEQASVRISHQDGRHFFHLQSLELNAEAAANIIYKNKTYVLSIYTCDEPMRSVTFYESSMLGGAGQVKRKQVTPEVLLNVLDRAKGYHFFKTQYPEIVQQIDVAQPHSETLYKQFDVVLEEVMRFDPEDTLVFKVKFKNKTDQDIFYQPQSLAVRVSDNVYYTSISDASGIIPACSESYGYFAVTGKPNGGRANLSVKNNFTVIVIRVEDVSLILPNPC